MTSFKYKDYRIEDFIEIVKNKGDRSKSYDPEYYYDVYGKESPDNKLVPGMEIYVGDTVQATDEGNEIYPPEVIARDLDFLFSSENFQSVIDLGTH